MDGKAANAFSSARTVFCTPKGNEVTERCCYRRRDIVGINAEPEKRRLLVSIVTLSSDQAPMLDWLSQTQPTDSRNHEIPTMHSLTVRPCEPLKVMYVRGGQTCFGAFWGKKSYRDVR
jgi:hypothetical protein